MVDYKVSEGMLLALTDKRETEHDSCIRSGKWLLGESRALKVGINAGLVALLFKNR